MNDTFNGLTLALQRADVDLTPSECQGVIAGYLCVEPDSDVSRCIKELLSLCEKNEALVQELRLHLERLARDLKVQLSDPNLKIHLLLPGDDNNLSYRVEMLTSLCRGLLFGLTLAGITQNSTLARNSLEFIVDLSEIAKAGVDEISDEADEWAYAEVVEYIRAGVLILQEELPSV